MALSDDILKLKELAKGGNPLQAGMEQAGGTSDLISSFEESILSMDSNRSAGLSPFGQTGIDAGNRFRDSILQSSQAPQVAPQQPLPIPPSIPTINQDGVDVPLSGERLKKWQEFMRADNQGAGATPTPNATAPSPTIDPSSRIPQDMQERIAGLNEVFARPNLVQNGSLASPSPAPTGAEFDFSGLPNISETGLSEEAFGRLSPTAQGSIIDVPTATEDRMTPTFQGMGAGGGQIAPEGMAPTIGPDGRAVFADRGTAQDLAEAELATQREDRAAQQRFLASPEAKEFSSRQLRSAIMGDGQFGRESVAREQRAAESFGQPRGPDSRDRDRRGTMSKADAVKLTGGDRVAADALLKRQELGLDEFAPEKETRSPEQIEQEQLANERSRQIIEQANKPDATAFQKKRGEWQERAEDLRESGASDKEIEARRRAFLYGDTFDPYEFQQNQGTGETTPESEAAPSGEGEATDTVDAKRARLEELRKKAGK